MAAAKKDITKKALYISNLGLMDNLGMTQILPYIKGLSRRGIKFTVISYEKRENLIQKDKIRDMKDTLDRHVIKWARLRYHNRWGNLYDIFIGIFTVTLLILRDRVDVIHARASIPIILSWPVARIFNKKIIYDRRGTMKGDFIDDVNVRNIFSLKLFSKILSRIDTFFVRHSDAVVVLSERGKRSLHDNELKGVKNIICESIPCCTDMKRFFAGDGTGDKKDDFRERFVMTYVGSLGTCYLLKEMADFFKVLKQKMKNALFLIISNTEKGPIAKLLGEEGLTPDVDYKIVNAKPGEVPGYLRKSDCSIMFIKEADCKIGASPTKFGESLSAGVPVLINRYIGDTEDIIRSEKVGVGLDRLDDAAYEKAVFRMLELLDGGEELRERCLRTAERYFSLDLGVERYTRIYERVNRE